MFNLDSALGIHPQALTVRARRAEMLAANLANADTPGYRARDIDFRQILANADSARTLRGTHARHIGTSAHGVTELDVRYRNPMQASLDQNSVDVQLERARFSDNAMRYQASLRFLDGKISGILTALRGE